MRDEWMLTYPGTSYRFGTRANAVQYVRHQFSGDTYRTDDTELPRQDGLAFGSDFVDPGELAIDILIDYSGRPEPARQREAMAWEARTAFKRAWRADLVRSTPGAVAELNLGGMIAVEGRPRRVVWNDDALNRGFVSGTAYFVPAGYGVYDLRGDGGAGWREQTVSLVPALSGGLLAPLRAPLSTSRRSSRERSFEVGGDVPAWPIITVKGPLQSGAQFELTGRWIMPLNRALGPYESVTIDTRPGRRAMYFGDRPEVVLTSRAVQLGRADLRPGLNEIAIRGTSVEGTATASIRWRDTKESI